MEVPMMTQPKALTERRVGLVPGVAQLAIEVAEMTQKTTIGVLQDVRGELRVTVEGTIELAEKTFASLMRITRKLTQRLDEAAAETLMSAERLIGSSVQTARETTRSASELASAAMDGIVGHRSAVA
jgi:hypothetical protein